MVAAVNSADRKRLLAQNPRIADARLAEEIRRICYAAWTAEPTKAQSASLALKALLTVNPADEIRAIAFWVSGISNLTKGKFEDAIDDLDRASALFRKIGLDHESAQTQVAKLLALALVGRYDDAIKTGRRALRVFVRFGDELAAGKIEMNLSNIAARRSLHRDAEKHGLLALKRFIAAGEKTWQSMAENDLANTYTELNDFRKAERYYGRALATARAAKMLVTEAEIEASMGNLAFLRGDFADALRYLELSRRKYELLGLPHQTAIADLEIADIYSALNLKSEALEIYKTVADAFRRLRLGSEEARARLNFGKAATSVGESKTALRELGRAERLYAAEKNDAGRAAVLLAAAKLELDEGNYERALDKTSKARAVIRADQDLRYAIAADLLEGDALRMKGEFAAAEPVLHRAHLAASGSGQADFARAALNSLAKTAVALGDVKSAEKLFKSAIRLTEKMRAPLAAEEFSMAFLADKLDAYESLALLYLDQRRFKDAFILTERARSRSLLDSMSNDQLAAPASRQLKKKLDDLRTELNWHYKRLDTADGADGAKRQLEIRRREKRIAEITRQIGSVTGKRTKRAPTDFSKIDLGHLKRQLGPDRILIEYVERDGNVSAFVAGGRKLDFVPDICRMSDVVSDLEDLQFQFGACRFGLSSLGKFKDELKRRADACLGNLYDRLIRPLEKCLTGNEIIFVPAGSLNYVPFPALFGGGGYLIERFTVTHAPGAAVWSALREKPRRSLKKALLVGFADERIPLVEKEIGALRKQFAGAKVLKGKRATFFAFSEFAPRSDLIHLACHGQFRPENPMFSSLHLADGWITVRDICTHRLKAELVTLSACETGLSSVFAGNEILGLVRGFLTAGASSLIVSLWTVNDAAAGRLMKDLYAGMQRGDSPAASLRQAQLKFIMRGDHPYLWSPFVSIGR